MTKNYRNEKCLKFVCPKIQNGTLIRPTTE